MVLILFSVNNCKLLTNISNIIMRYDITQHTRILNPKIYKLSIFKTSTTPTSHILSTKYHTPKLNPYMNFKSFFVFLKPKPFVIKNRYNLLQTLRINPKPYSLSNLIKLTKRFSPQSLNNSFTTQYTHPFISKKNLKLIIFSTKNKTKKKLFFNLFKHKMFSYTTAKKLTFYQHSTNSHLSNLDFRTMLTLSTYSKEFPNVGNISTYNWRIVN